MLELVTTKLHTGCEESVPVRGTKYNIVSTLEDHLCVYKCIRQTVTNFAKIQESIHGQFGGLKAMD